jgi:hypothetical protein
MGICVQLCTSTGSAGPEPGNGGTHHSSLELSTVIRTEPSLRTTRFSMKYLSGKYATGVKVTAGTGVIGIAASSASLLAGYCLRPVAFDGTS